MKKIADEDVKPEENVEKKEGTSNEKDPGNKLDAFFSVNDKRAWTDEDDYVIDLIQKNAQLNFFSREYKQKAEESEKKLFEYIEAYKKKMEENDAFKRRLELSLEKKLDQSKGDILMSVLPVKDNLDRAVSSVNGNGDINALLDGINMVRKLFLDQMKEFGLTAVDALGKPFDPERAEAVAVEQVSEEVNDNMVLEEFEPGYQFGGRLLRPARVKVGKYNAPDSSK